MDFLADKSVGVLRFRAERAGGVDVHPVNVDDEKLPIGVDLVPKGISDDALDPDVWIVNLFVEELGS